MHNLFVIIQILCLHLFYVTSISNNKTTTTSTIPPIPPPPPSTSPSVESLKSPSIGVDEKNKQTDKRSLLIGDLSYSYTATDIGSPQGSHIKTITVIKNIAVPDPRDESYKSNLHHQHHHHHQQQQQQQPPQPQKSSEWISNSQFKFNIPNIPEIPNVNFFGVDERPPTSIPTSSMRSIIINQPAEPVVVAPSPISDQQKSVEKNNKNKEKIDKEKNIECFETDEQQKPLQQHQKQQESESLPQTLKDDVSINYKAQMDHIVKVAKIQIGEKLPEAMSFTKYSTKPLDNKSIKNEQKLPPNDVEFIQMGSPIGLDQAERSKQAQLRRSKELQKYNEGVNNKNRGDRGVVDSVGSTTKSNIENISKYSLQQNVKLNLDPLKVVAKQQYKYNSSPTTQSTESVRSSQIQEIHQIQESHHIPININQYGRKIEQKSQSYIDVSKNARKIYQNGPPVHPYVAPSIKRAYSTSSTTTQRPYVAPLKNRGPQTFYLIHEPVTTTQRPYLAPNLYKPYNINNEQQKIEEKRLKTEREAIELEQQTQELQQLHEKNQQNKQPLVPRHEKIKQQEQQQHHQSMQQIKNDQQSDTNKDVGAQEPSASHYGKLEVSKETEQIQSINIENTQQSPITHQEIKATDQQQQQQQLPAPMALTLLTSATTILQTNLTSSLSETKPKNRRTRQHRRHNKHRGFIAIPLDISTKLPYANDDETNGNSLSTQKIAAHLIRHPYVFDSSPPHSFLQSPFKPSREDIDVI